VSIGDIGLPGITKKEARNFTGNTHGGMVCVKGQWYIFYHRQTNQQKCARQGCAEKISIEQDGSIKQVEVTSCGLNSGPLKAIGNYEARIACNLWGDHGTLDYNKVRLKETEYPYFTQTGVDRESNPDQFIRNMKNGAVAGFKYFNFDEDKPSSISVKIKGSGNGKIMVYTELNPFEKGDESNLVAKIDIKAVETISEMNSIITNVTGVKALYFQYLGEGYLDFISFCLQ
jgi:hypothetical protein